MFILFGIAIIVPGALMIIKTEWLLKNFGPIAWFERKFGAEGGSRLGYKLIGLAIVFIGVVVMTGSGEDFTKWALSPLLKYSK